MYPPSSRWFEIVMIFFGGPIYWKKFDFLEKKKGAFAM